MSKQYGHSQGQFRQFVDETSPEQAAEIEKNWKKKNKQQKNKLFSRILITATILIAIVFVVTLNFFIDNKKTHILLDQDQDGFTLVQTTFPHIKVFVSNQAQTFETRMVRTLGIVYPELISWIEANVVSNNKVLYVPNQKSGTNVLGMALGYYLSSENGGSLEILSRSEAYQQQLTKNAQLMKNFKNQSIIFKYLSAKDQMRSNYSLLVIENNDFLGQIQIEQFKRVVEVKRRIWDKQTVANYMGGHTKYEVSKGRFSSQILALGQFKSYSLVQLRESSREEYKIILVLSRPEANINLCPEKIQPFKKSSEKRNLLEYFRNKTLLPKELVFFCLDDTHTLDSITQLDNLAPSIISGQHAIQSITQQKSPYSNQVNHTYVISSSHLSAFKTKLKGQIIILVSTQQQVPGIETLASTHTLKMILPLNNNGCLFPAAVLGYQRIKPFHPFFLLVTLN